MQEFHFFDLDWTLWKTDSKLCIINKNQPNIIIHRIDPIYKPMMKTYWKNYNLPVHYNGQQWWLSKEIWDNLKRKNKKIKLTDLGISYRDWTDKEIIEKQKNKTEYLFSNLKYLKNKWNVSINFLTARSNKEAHREVLKDIKESIYRKLKIKVNKTYFVNDFESELNDDNTASRKSKILLEHLIGYKIRNNKFIDLKQTETNTIHFYDDNSKNIDAANSLQNIFDICISKTDPMIKKDIIDRIKTIDLKFNTYLITNNDIEPFKKFESKLILPNDLKIIT